VHVDPLDPGGTARKDDDDDLQKVGDALSEAHGA
jgi:hypothetical protein